MTGISIAQRRGAQWPWDARALEDSRARQAAEDSSSVWELTLPKKSGELPRRVVQRPLEKSPAAQMQLVALEPASPPPGCAVR